MMEQTLRSFVFLLAPSQEHMFERKLIKHRGSDKASFHNRILLNFCKQELFQIPKVNLLHSFVSFSFWHSSHALAQEHQIHTLHYQDPHHTSTPHFSNLQILLKRFSIQQGGIKCANRRTGFIDSEGSHQSQDPKDPKHMLFCRETAFVVIYALFQG